jgi:hypothetical protein
VPVAPESIVIHATLLVAVQAQPVGEVTLTVPVVRLSGASTLVGEIVVVHATACCVTVTV